MDKRKKKVQKRKPRKPIRPRKKAIRKTPADKIQTQQAFQMFGYKVPSQVIQAPPSYNPMGYIPDSSQQIAKLLDEIRTSAETRREQEDTTETNRGRGLPSGTTATSEFRPQQASAMRQPPAEMLEPPMKRKIKLPISKDTLETLRRNLPPPPIASPIQKIDSRSAYYNPEQERSSMSSFDRAFSIPGQQESSAIAEEASAFPAFPGESPEDTLRRKRRSEAIKRGWDTRRKNYSSKLVEDDSN